MKGRRQLSFTDSEIDAILAQYEPWVRRKAKQFPKFPAEDLVQEALIAMWKELKKFDPSKNIPLDYIMKRRCSWRMMDIVSGKPWTSNEPYYRHTGLKSNDTVSLDEPYSQGAYDQARDFSAERAFEDVDFSYHFKDIKGALNGLTSRQREYAVVRLMYGFKQSEIIDHFGYEAHGLFTNKHKDQLRNDLSHLESLVN
jgi:RNA polymerase sigma factor (sigma-70 family)